MESLNAQNTANFDLDDSGCVQDTSEGDNGSRRYPQLLDLSDDVLLYILVHLTPRDLKALGHTCPRLGTLILDQTLWKKVDARNTPVGPKRLKWLLNHCLSDSTKELQISGYVNKYSKCLGIQDLNWPTDTDHDFIRSTFVGTQEGVDVEHFLLRMWYPHLPRYAVSPRWPDKKETETTNAKCEEVKRLAEEAKLKARAASGAWCPCGKLDKPAKKPAPVHNLAPEAGSSGQSSSSTVPTAPRSGILEQIPCSSGPFSSASGPRAGGSGQSASASNLNAGSSDQSASNADRNGENSGESKEDKDDYASIFGEDEFRDECKGPHFSLTRKIMVELKSKCTQLTFLALEYCNLDYKTTNLRQFPRGLRKLSLRGTRCYNLPLNTSFLGKVQERLPVIEYLDVSECDWFEPASLMPLSKLSRLTELYMRDCKRLTECVAYASLATRYGFRQLRVFDVRGSPLADSEISALGWLPRLEELYVSPPEEFTPVTEHTHAWSCTKNVHDELDPWELEEPEYYRVKSPEPELEPDDKDDDDLVDRQGDIMFSNPWWSHERRIIVIQPNARRQLEEHYPLMNRQQQQQPMDEAPANQQGPPRPIIPVGGPPVPDIPIMPEELHPFRRVPARGDQVPPPVPVEPPAPGPAHPKPVPVDPREELQLQPGPNGKEGPSTQIQQSIRPGISKPEAGSSNSQPGPSNAQAGPSCHPGPSNQPGPSNAQAGPSCHPGPSNQPGPSNAQAGPSCQPGPSYQSGPSNARAGPSCQPGPSYQSGPSNAQAGHSCQPGPSYQSGPSNAQAGHSCQPGPSYQSGPSNAQAGHSCQLGSSYQSGPSNAQAGHSCQLGSSYQSGPSNAQAGPSCQPGPSNAQAAGPSCQPGPSHPQPGPSRPQPGPSNPPGPANAGESASKRRFNINDAVDLAKRRRLADEEADEFMYAMQPPVQVEAMPLPPFPPAYNIAERCPRLRMEMERMNNHPEQDAEMPAVHPGCVLFRRHDMVRPVMHIDVDIHRQSTTSIGAHLGYHLVSDSALLRFGRAENENVNYVHIGRNGIHHGSDSASRPNRSNLRILSVTGYRNITDRSLEHLVTAAPYLLHVDFSETNVTPRGVELFRAVRPECEVIYSEFNRLP